MMIPSGLLRNMVLMMLLMAAMVIPAFCQQMEIPLGPLYDPLYDPSIHNSGDVPPRMDESNPTTPHHIRLDPNLIQQSMIQDKYRPTYMG